MIAQIDSIIETAQKGATLGGQSILILAVIALGYTVIALNKAGGKRIDVILGAAEKQRTTDLAHHSEVVETFRVERESYKAERADNFQTLLQISKESARGLESAAAAIQAQATATLAQVAATNSLRDTMHAVRNELNQSHMDREVAKGC